MNDRTDSSSTPTALTGSELLTGDGPLTPQQATAALEAFREDVIRPAMQEEWDAQRSILRPAMIETFVAMRMTDPNDWHIQIPQYLRIGTNPAEKTRFLDRICEIVERIAAPSTPKPEGTPPIARGETTTREGDSAGSRKVMASGFGDAIPYTFADLTTIARPDRERFFDDTYTATIRSMIALVIEVEGPIFEDVLVDRIARAHDLRRSGNRIRNRVAALRPSRLTFVREGTRKVVWGPGKEPGLLPAYREDPTGRRGHEDVPLEELAALAAPFVRLRLQEDAILRRMGSEFGLEVLRESTRSKFLEALNIARKSMVRS